jgi:hypothetical protein
MMALLMGNKTMSPEELRRMVDERRVTGRRAKGMA